MRGPRTTQGWSSFLALASILAVAAACVIAVVVANRGDDEPDAVETELSGPCASLHGGHNMMMWDPTMADEMADLDCGWPYEPFLVPTDGGAEDPAFDAAPFEARRYADLWTLTTGSGVGVCAVSTLPDAPADGFVFGFDYAISEPGCPGVAPAGHLVAREYATRAWRDAAAHEVTDGEAFVLGRWVVSVAADDPVMAAALEAGLVELGAAR